MTHCNRVMVLSLGLLLMLSACTWVKLSKEAEAVSVRQAENINGCKMLGRTTASLKDKIMGLDRDAEKIQAELETLARNAAVDLGGNVVVPSSDIENGRQSFDVFACP